MLTDRERETLFEVASRLTTSCHDTELVAANARTLAVWASSACDRPDSLARRDARLRLGAIEQVFHNLRRAEKLPMDDLEGFVDKAAVAYVFLGGDAARALPLDVDVVKFDIRDLEHDQWPERPSDDDAWWKSLCPEDYS